MRMFIPEIGTRIVLTQPWSLLIYCEHRNEAVHGRLRAGLAAGEFERMQADAERLSDAHYEECRKRYSAGFDQERAEALLDQAERAKAIPLILPVGTELTVDRIYIRKGVSAFSSLTFHLTRTAHPLLSAKGRRRFWAKLDQVNQMEFDLLQPQEAAA